MVGALCRVLNKRERFGVFIDYPGVLTVDAGYSRYSELKITASDWNLDCYIITGTDTRYPGLPVDLRPYSSII